MSSGFEEGNLGADELAVAAALEPLGVIADDAGVGGFGAGGGDGHHGRDRQAVLDGCLFGPEVPGIAGIARGDCNPLGAVHRRAAADWQDYVDLLALGERRALAHEGDLGIGAHTAQFYMGHAGGVERGLYAVERARANHGALAVYDQGAAISGFR